MTATTRWFACALAFVAMLPVGCGGNRVAAAGADDGRAVQAATSQDHLPPIAAPASGSVAVDAAAEARSRDACRHWIATTCMQASLHSEAMCRLARCEQVAGFWVLKIPRERIEEDLRRRGY